MRRKLLILLLLGACHRPFDVAAQYCPPAAPPVYPFPNSRTTPLQTLLFVRIAGPEGMKVTFYRGPRQAVTLDAPCTVGLRPGFFYRLAVTGMKAFPGQAFYPSLEVRGSLLLGGSLRAVDYPAGLVFKERDFSQAVDGAFIKKVIFVEKVENALPEPSPPDNPLELTMPPNRDPLTEARERGLPVMIVEMGQREMPVEDLLAQAIPGTILLPGDPYLPRPSQSPCLPWSCYPLYDPLLGPAPWLYYSLPDGGDWGPRAGFDSNGKLRGVDPADTVVTYQDKMGRQRLSVSNRVCLCIPRFLVARNDAGPGSRPGVVESAMNVKGAQGTRGQLAMDASRSPKANSQLQHLEGLKDTKRAGAIENLQGTSVTGRIQNLDVRGSIVGPGAVTGTKPPRREQAGPEEDEPGPDAPLKVDKWPDSCGGGVGSVITFYIRYTNVGGKTISNVVVTDNLISRFEYVKGSAKTSRSANFTTQPNDVGSTIVRWEIDGVLRPRESAVVSFQVRIR